MDHPLGPRGARIVLMVAIGPHYALDLTAVFKAGRSFLTAGLAD